MRVSLLAAATLLRLAALLCLAALPPGRLSAQEAPAATRLQDATVIAKGSTISIRRLPIHTAGGILYRDVTIELQVDAQGHVSLATAAPASLPTPGGGRQLALQSVPSAGTGGAGGVEPGVELAQRPSPPIVMQIFRAGTYSAADGALVHILDRGNDLVHRLPNWSLTADGTGVIASATWWSGPPDMNPKHRRLKDANIYGTDYAYGIVDGGSDGPFGSGALIGVAQAGNTLRFVSFHHGCCSDQEAPVASITYTYAGP